MAKITLQTTENQISFDADIDFDLYEIPVYAQGYRNNGSSRATPENLEKYWTLIDDFFSSTGMDVSTYHTLLRIEVSDGS